MNIPQLPTDNLYKFKSITFAFLTAVSLALMFLSLKDNLTKFNDPEIRERINESQTFQERIDTLNIQLQKLDLLMLENSKDSFNINPDSESLKKWKFDLIKQKHEWKINKIYADNNTDLAYNDDDSLYDISYWGAAVLFLFSLMMMSHSFKQWKEKLQIYQDIILQKEAGMYVEHKNNPTETVKEGSDKNS